MKVSENQELKSSNILVMLGLLGLCLSIISTPWNRGITDPNSTKALQRAEIVGYQLVQLYREAAKVDSTTALKASRGPASVSSEVPELRTIGTMGLDPWGQPFHYRILSADQNKLRVLVWSSGPNQSVESNELVDEDFKLSTQPTFSGDDIGVVMMMSVN